MLRITIVTSVALSLGCTLTPGHGMGGAFAEGGAVESSDGGEVDSGAPADEGGDVGSSGGGVDDGGDEVSSSGAGTFNPMDDSSSGGADEGGSSGEESTGAPADGGADEPGGAYAPCDTSEDCGEDPPSLACLHAEENGAGGFCSAACGTYGQTPPDANLCPDAPEGVTATVVCLEGLVRNCALACQADGDCPQGTACLMANNGHGPYCFGV